MSIFELSSFGSPLQKLSGSFLERHGIELSVKREDLIHPLVSGNKWRKLKYNLTEASQKNHKTILSFGGAYSNHIYALAAAGKIWGFEIIGVIRGEEHPIPNPTLSFAKSCGMKLIYLSREKYQKKEESEVIELLEKELPPFYYVPEGGSNQLGVKGCEEIVAEISEPFDIICTACGTGGTVSGLINSVRKKQKVLGFCALKGEGMLDKVVKNFTSNASQPTNWEIRYDYHWGGYAKIKLELIGFMEHFKQQFDIQLEPVYTAKMFYGLFDLIQKGYFSKGTKIIALHTGGLQGLEGMKEKIDRIRKSDNFGNSINIDF